MVVMYLISTLILIISFILIKKTDKEINIANSICISVVLLMCYNMLTHYILTFLTITVKLWILSVINIIISFIFIIPIIKSKKVQKYFFKKVDLLCMFIIAVVVIAVAYINFGFPFNINYESTDASVHYLASTMFANSDGLLASKSQYDTFYSTLATMRIGSYVNIGLLIKCFSNASNFMTNYKLFIMFDMAILFLIGSIMYFSLRNFAKKNTQIIWCLLISLICLLGYPLNSTLFGFDYLTLGLLIVITIINVMFYYSKNIMKLRYIVIMIFLLNFGLFSSYYMFVTFVYPTIWIYFCVENYNRTNKIITKKLLLMLTTTLIIPFILGFIYYMVPNIYGFIINKNINMDSIMNTSDYLLNSGLKANGYTYINLYSNMILLIPSIIYLIIKDKESNKLIILFSLFNILVISILVLGNSFGKVSSYYISKNYYTLWIFLLHTSGMSLIILSEKSQYLPRLLLYSYITMIIISVSTSNLEVKYELSNKRENIVSIMEIFQANKTILIDKPNELNQEELEILKYVKNHINPNSYVDVVADEGAYCWVHSLINFVSNENEYKEYGAGEKALATKSCYISEKIGKVDYMIYFKNNKIYKRVEDKLFNNAEIIYENSAGGILKYNH